ncbi:3-dehydroquinate synthase [Neobacillus notoginsengisoli]|uniref:3-dehydroquinate synthase n=1 Tax=Neobacillus notoginsengisoli TaxID=1578198 RepID=A0A417YVF0_9BACI|nr:3-dehydroquinate synthase [Neobacillus notoginsengisoli]RHW41250.1 3-dehydroquinate synthase [Neobacillus notoginsengisoli]
MQKLELSTAEKKYPIVIGENAVSSIAPFLQNDLNGFSRLMIMTDQNVGKLHLENLLKQLDEFRPAVFSAPAGEKAKSLEIYEEAITFSLENGLDRKSFIIAFGGGAIGDLAGFVAATFMRGIRFIQVPTTILAHDSSVGGKTGINHHLGKNMIGAFHQPEAVFYDLSFINSLPPHEVRSGFAEVVKHALIGDPDLFDWLRMNVSSLEGVTPMQYEEMLAKGISVKAKIVRQDVHEKGIRAYLNFGHTLGHAIEAEMGYGNITHGEAVMIGMVFALEISKEKSGLDFELDGFKTWIESIGYRTSLSSEISKEGLLKRMKKDKKAIGGTVRFVLLNKIGVPELVELPDSFLKKKLGSFL